MQDHEYDLLRQYAVEIENMFRSMLDVPQHAMARILRDEFRDLIIDIRGKKHPKTIEGRVQRIQQYLLKARTDGYVIMRIDENVELLKHCDKFKLSLRRFPNYQ